MLRIFLVNFSYFYQLSFFWMKFFISNKTTQRKVQEERNKLSWLAVPTRRSKGLAVSTETNFRTCFIHYKHKNNIFFFFIKNELFREI